MPRESGHNFVICLVTLCSSNSWKSEESQVLAKQGKLERNERLSNTEAQVQSWKKRIVVAKQNNSISWPLSFKAALCANRPKQPADPENANNRDWPKVLAQAKQALLERENSPKAPASIGGAKAIGWAPKLHEEIKH